MPDEMRPDDVDLDETMNPDETPPRFRLGRPVATVGALAAVVAAGLSPQALLARHARGDWGDLCEADRRENERSLPSGGRLLSCYRLTVGEDMMDVWVITEADRSATTLLLPSEY